MQFFSVIYDRYLHELLPQDLLQDQKGLEDLPLPHQHAGHEISWCGMDSTMLCTLPLSPHKQAASTLVYLLGLVLIICVTGQGWWALLTLLNLGVLK